MCSRLWCRRKGELKRVRLFGRWADDSVLNSELCATDITHGLKLADDNQSKRNSGNPTARQGKTETCVKDPMANEYGVRKRSATEDRQGYPCGSQGYPCGKQGCSHPLGQCQLRPNKRSVQTVKGTLGSTQSWRARFRREEMQGV